MQAATTTTRKRNSPKNLHPNGEEKVNRYTYD
jgi:hypothetical protein